MDAGLVEVLFNDKNLLAMLIVPGYLLAVGVLTAVYKLVHKFGSQAAALVKNMEAITEVMRLSQAASDDVRLTLRVMSERLEALNERFKSIERRMDSKKGRDYDE